MRIKNSATNVDNKKRLDNEVSLHSMYQYIAKQCINILNRSTHGSVKLQVDEIHSKVIKRESMKIRIYIEREKEKILLYCRTGSIILVRIR